MIPKFRSNVMFLMQVLIKVTYTLGTHSLTVLSLEADAIRCPEGENFTDNIASCPNENIFGCKTLHILLNAQ